MSDMEFSFEAAPWEPYVDSLRPRDRASASTLLSLMEGETDEVFEEVMVDAPLSTMLEITLAFCSSETSISVPVVLPVK